MDGKPAATADAGTVAAPQRRRGGARGDVMAWALALLACAFAATILQLEAGRDGGYFVIVCLYALTACAAFSDAALRKVPNRFSYPALLLALGLNCVIAPALELLQCTSALRWIGANTSAYGGVALESLLGFALCTGIGLLSFAARGLGGGDVKVMLVLGALAGWSLSISILLNALLVAAGIGIINLLLRGWPVRLLQDSAYRAYCLLLSGGELPVRFARTESPFCLSLLIGLLLLPWMNAHAEVRALLQRVAG